MPARSSTRRALKQREYQHDYRERVKRRLLGFSGYASPTLVDELINSGLLPEEEISNKKSVGMAVLEAASLWLQNLGRENNR